MILRDPVHGLIAFESPESAIVEKLIDTPEVQRLRRIRQLGYTSLAYPGAEHSRFAHAVGTAHVMLRLARRLTDIQSCLPPQHRLTPELVSDALAAALLHDLGHGPLSHMFENALPGAARHEVWTTRILRDPDTQVHRILASHDHAMPERVANLIEGHHALTYLARAISGTYDVDRCDYLLRDAHATGVRYGHFDLDWFHRSLRFAPSPTDGTPPPLAIDGAKGIAGIESFVLARLFMFQQVYFHKATRAAEWMVHAALSRAVRLIADGTALPGTPAAMVSSAAGRSPSLSEYLELDDGVFAATLHAWESGPDPALADLCARLRRRHLFKTIELHEESATNPDLQRHALTIAREITAAHHLDPDVYVGIDRATDTPFDDRKDTLVVVFGHGKPRRPAEVSFLLGRLDGHALTRVRLIVPPEVREPVAQALAS